jgi:spermidine/putrescine-binding protein
MWIVLRQVVDVPALIVAVAALYAAGMRAALAAPAVMVIFDWGDRHGPSARKSAIALFPRYPLGLWHTRTSRAFRNSLPW